MPRILSIFSNTSLIGFLDRLRTNFWFLPSTMAATAIVLSFALVEVDNWLGVKAIRESAWLYTFGPEGARAILTAVASSMITVAGLSFSITMLTLQLASSQFGPRVLRNFMRDRGNQVVLGTFIATFIYCLLVLRTIRGTEASSFVPHLSVAFGVLLAIASLAVLIFFIHHVAASIRIEMLLEQLSEETGEAIDRLYPESVGEGAVCEADDPRAVLPGDFEANACPVPARRSGYVQQVNNDALMHAACEHDLIVRIIARPGRFVAERDPLLSAYPRTRVSSEVSRQLADSLVLGSERTPYQDLEFSIRRIVEIAQRALSPGTNDPTTAMYCIDRLGQALGRLADRKAPSSMRLDQEGRLRVVTEVSSFEELASPALTGIARYASEDADVIRHLLEMSGRVSRHLPPGPRAELAELAETIRRESEEQLWLSPDRKSVRSCAGRYRRG